MKALLGGPVGVLVGDLPRDLPGQREELVPPGQQGIVFHTQLGSCFVNC